MSALFLLKLIKWLGVVAFSAGLIGAVLPRDLADRQAAAYWLATPGIVLVWLGGFGLTKLTHISMGSPWLSASMLLSLVALQAVVWGVERAERGRAAVAVVAVVALVATLALMVTRPGNRLAPSHDLGAVQAAPDAVAEASLLHDADEEAIR